MIGRALAQSTTLGAWNLVQSMASLGRRHCHCRMASPKPAKVPWKGAMPPKPLFVVSDRWGRCMLGLVPCACFKRAASLETGSIGLLQLSRRPPSLPFFQSIAHPGCSCSSNPAIPLVWWPFEPLAFNFLPSFLQHSPFPSLACSAVRPSDHTPQPPT